MKRRLWLGVLAIVLAGPGAWAGIGGGDISFTVSGMPAVVFSHEAHVVKAKLKCTECHYQLYTNHAEHKAVRMEGMRRGKSCGACHNGVRAFSVTAKDSCGRCHNRT